MKRLSFTVFALMLHWSTHLSAAAFQFDVSLNSFDHLAEDTAGQFYYDVYNFISTAPTPVMVSLTSPDFEPWLGAWDQEYLPKFLWQDGLDLYTAALDIESGNIGETISFIFNAVPGVVYQISPATLNYNPTPLGDYSLLIETPVIPGMEDEFPDGVPFTVTPVVVPLPAAVWLLASTLGLLSLRRRG